VLLYTAGIEHCFIELMPLLTLRAEQAPPSNEDRRLLEEEMKVIKELYEIMSYSPDYLLDITKVMTDLYKDPANTCITFSIMIDIAYQKFKGKDIELLLQEARREALYQQKGLICSSLSQSILFLSLPYHEFVVLLYFSFNHFLIY